MKGETMYKETIEDIDRRIKELKKTREIVLKDWVEAEHPLKKGDRVEVNGYSHKGKTMAINSLKVTESYRGWEWKAGGYIIKKNGEEGFNYGEWSQRVAE